MSALLVADAAIRRVLATRALRLSTPCAVLHSSRFLPDARLPLPDTPASGTELALGRPETRGRNSRDRAAEEPADWYAASRRLRSTGPSQIRVLLCAPVRDRELQSESGAVAP